MIVEKKELMTAVQLDTVSERSLVHYPKPICRVVPGSGKMLW